MSSKSNNNLITQREKEFAALSYVWVFAVFIYFSSEAKSNYVKYHARQGIVLFVLSIIFFLLPGYLSYLNVLVVFLMIFCIIEAVMGSWYQLPLIGDWIQGIFKKQHFYLFYDIFNNVKKLLQKKTEKEKPLFKKVQEKEVTEKLEKIIYLEHRKEWDKDILYFENYLKQILKDKKVRIEVFGMGMNIFYQGEKIMIFGGVKKDNFIFAYKKDLIFLPGDLSVGNFEIRKYSIQRLNKGSFSAFIQLVFENKNNI